ncbi:hypothetical protein [Mesorhizobium humile]|uniref:Uncharacterized protein n=1 Tax=Mesorhizobium humile TaxID=3072313 RepID=A0ABU4YFG7_9HYPH|nr:MULTISPECIES: hypothetical protein [unclassified Mesorhizobium]MDX8458862.1 hypothetical protein [Mesorhizobium sp. VK2D]MDX8484644.1 hypothetical protein [Mesorhizobium sp. VK2B]
MQAVWREAVSGMDIDYQHLLAGAVPTLRFGPATAPRIEVLLVRARGCVTGRQAGRPYIDFNIDGISHRVEFDREADMKQLLARIKARGTPLHRDREVILAVLGMGAVLVLAIALAVWLRP